MIDENELIKVYWNSRNKKYFESKGYVFTKLNEEFYVPVKDLDKKSSYYITTKCDYCGKDMKIKYVDYNRKIDKYGVNYCKSCLHKHTENKRIEEHYQRVKNICDELGYELLTDKNDMKTYDSFIEYVCPLHGPHKVKIGNLFNGKRCPGCAIEDTKNSLKLSKEKLIKKISDCGSNIINPDEYINNSEKNLKITCPRCGQMFITSFKHFVQHGGQLCSECSKKESIGELKVRRFLEKHNIEFSQEYWFPDCRDINPLPFDFYLPQLNVIIEFDGIQHFKDTNYFIYSFEKNKMHDKIKNDYCALNNIELIRIPYWDINKIDNILEEKLFTQ